MKKLNKKILSVLLCLTMAVSMAMAASASGVTLGSTGAIYAYAGKKTNNSKVALCATISSAVAQSHGPVYAQVTSSPTTWYVKKCSFGDYTINYANTDYYANLYRVLQPNNYYPCRLWTLSSNGEDQRVVISTGTIYSADLSGVVCSTIRLAVPYMGGNWYMVADKSSVASYTDVIWYTDGTSTRSRWAM